MSKDIHQRSQLGPRAALQLAPRLAPGSRWIRRIRAGCLLGSGVFRRGRGDHGDSSNQCLWIIVGIYIYIYIYILAGGIPTPLKNDGVKVSWDDDIPNIWKNNIHVPNHQPVYNRLYIYIYMYGKVLWINRTPYYPGMLWIYFNQLITLFINNSGEFFCWCRC